MSLDAIVQVQDIKGNNVAAFYCRYNCYLEDFIPLIRQALSRGCADQAGIDYIPACLIHGLIHHVSQIKLLQGFDHFDGSYVHHITLKALPRFCEQGVPRAETFMLTLRNARGENADHHLLHEWAPELTEEEIEDQSEEHW